jgi:hypothetical protein
MDVYTASFTLPRHSRHAHAGALSRKESSIDFPIDPLAAAKVGTNGLGPDMHVSPTATDAEAVQNLALMVMTLRGCHVSVAVADGGKGWNFLVSGAYNQVMAARGMVLKDCPIPVSFHNGILHDHASNARSRAGRPSRFLAQTFSTRRPPSQRSSRKYAPDWTRSPARPAPTLQLSTVRFPCPPARHPMGSAAVLAGLALKPNASASSSSPAKVTLSS